MNTQKISRSTRPVHADDDECALAAPVDSAVGIAAFALFGGPLFDFETGVASHALRLFASDDRVTHRCNATRSLMKGKRT